MKGLPPGVVAHPPVFGARSKTCNTEKVKGIRGVTHVVKLSGRGGVAVVGSHFWAAKKGRDALEVEWDLGPNAALSTPELVQRFSELARTPGKVARKADNAEAIKGAAKTIVAEYQVPFLAHAPMEPLNCTVDVRADSAELWVGSQFQTVDQGAAARTLGLKPEQVKVNTMLDDVAAASGKDPLQLRRELLAKNPRVLKALELAAAKSGWGSALPKGRARGIAMHESFGSVCAQVAEVSLAGNDVRVHKVTAAFDCGLVVNPLTVEAQVQSAVAFGMSAALHGKITFKDGKVEQSNFHDYRVLRMNEMPIVEVHLVTGGEKPTGVGEPGTPPVAPAIANALFALTGKRARALPLDSMQWT